MSGGKNKGGDKDGKGEWEMKGGGVRGGEVRGGGVREKD